MPRDGDAPLLGLSMRVPPSNLQAEQALLGALLANNAAYEHVAGFLAAEHFADPIHAAIFQAIARRAEAGQLADAVTLKGEFEHSPVLDEVGGVGYLAQLLTAMVGIINAGEYGRAIHDCWVRRRLIDVGENVVNDAFAAIPGEDSGTLIGAAMEQIMALGDAGASRTGADFASVAGAVVRRADAAHRGSAGQARLDTGIAPVDRLWNGLWPGQLYYLMARSRTGKTPAMMQIARNVAGSLRAESERTGAPLEHVHIFSLEMTAEDLLTINLASVTRWSADQIRSGNIGDDAGAWHALAAAATELGRLPIVLDDRAEMDIAALALRARVVARQKRTRLICIDYREMVRRPREHAKMGLPEWIPFLGYQLKALAKALNVPIIALAQINKSRDGQETTRPTLSDLPYDGGQAADSVFALHRPELYMGDEPPKATIALKADKQAERDQAWRVEREAARGKAEFLALKRRFGPSGMCALRFVGPRMLLREIGHDAETPPDLWGEP